MSDKKISLWDLEKHETKDTLDSHINGELTVVWRDCDILIKDHPKMVYINSINPGEKKGPHLHKKRTTYLPNAMNTGKQYLSRIYVTEKVRMQVDNLLSRGKRASSRLGIGVQRPQ